MRGTIKKIATIVFAASMVGLFFKPVSVNAYMENEMNEISITDTDGELLGMLAFEINSIPVAYASFPNQSVEAPNYTTGVASTSELSSRLNALISKYQGTYWTSNGSACSNHSSTCYSKYYYGWQCKGFASYIFNDLFCGGYIGAYDSNMYYIPSANNATLVGKSWGFSSTDTATVKSILSKGQVGDFIQVRRRDKSYGHSMILAGVDANGIYVFDCNSDGKCGVKYVA